MNYQTAIKNKSRRKNTNKIRIKTQDKNSQKFSHKKVKKRELFFLGYKASFVHVIRGRLFIGNDTLKIEHTFGNNLR